MKLRRVWHGYLKRYPADPDSYLARHIAWSRGFKVGVATAPYPEPLNLIAAAAWLYLPANLGYQHVLIYYDTATQLWVTAIGIRDLSVDQLETWILEQFSRGAQAVWTNDGAQAPRLQPSLVSKDDEPGTFGSSSKDPITLTIRLKDMNKYRVGDIDLTELCPDKFAIDEKRLVILQDYDPTTAMSRKSKKSTPKLPGQGSGNSRCVYTPMGVFPSIKLAAQAHELTMSKMYALVASNIEGYGYLTKQEYLRQQALNTVGNQ